MERFVGIDVGAETLKVVELSREDGKLRWTRRHLREHLKNPGALLPRILGDLGWNAVSGAAVTGRLGRQLNLQRVPTKQAQSSGAQFLAGAGPKTVVSIGGHGFSVLEVRPNGGEILRENSRCSQGTGNFLRQLVERFDLSIEAAAELAASTNDPAPLSGRCPVVLKTDMTHLANKGESRARILAGLFDAVCENVQVLIKPRISPPEVLLVGGVSRSTRVKESFKRFLAKHDMSLRELEGDDALFIEALGSAVVAAERQARVPELGRLFARPSVAHLERVPALGRSLEQVVRMKSPVRPAREEEPPASRDLCLGFDIGSTGSKVVALDSSDREVVWEGYLKTHGDPVGAAQNLVRQFLAGPFRSSRVLSLGVTGSGRELVGSLMTTCHGKEAVFVLNEIAAHAEGARHYDPRVDTIFEIGGQDAKYIRLSDGRVVDAAMNEACSAGTGSFIEEQGKRFAGVESVSQLGQEALGSSDAVALGQHCSVFMAEIIDEAVAAGVEQRSIIAGIYDSIIQNYLNRVKGSRSVGKVIFCQGMPFAADALAAAVARQTGSQVIIPPNPGTVGALGIALLALKEAPEKAQAAVDLSRFLSTGVEEKDTFVCKATSGCGGAGNKCRIDRIRTVALGERQRFTWGGGCSLYDKGTRKKKLPDLAPDPFREREELVADLIAGVSRDRGRPRVGITDEFQLKSLFPFFATFIHELGFDLDVHTAADRAILKRGIEEANIPFCAPMQQYHGLVSKMVEKAPSHLFLPMLRETPKVKDEQASVLCPIVQGSTDMLRLDFERQLKSKVISPVIDVGDGNFDSAVFMKACRDLAAELGAADDGAWRKAHALARDAQNRFDRQLLALGRKALSFCETKGITPIVVLGRGYTICNTVLNSNVPAIIREQGAIAIPVDCYPVADAVPVFEDMFWGYGQRILRAAHQIRRTPGHYSLFCSNYACGPDSFSIHFYSYIMEGKPFAIIETDGHSGDAGTKTRVEAFLHCVNEDLGNAAARKRPRFFKLIELDKEELPDIRRRGERVLIPRMGPGADVVAAILRGIGIPAEGLPLPDRDAVRTGRRHTSGKECVPMTITLGSLLERLERERDTDECFAFFMPGAAGPCRFGAYSLLHKIVLERLGWKERVRIWAPPFDDYSEGVPPGFS
jgi:predicted CoA-substrate-specific enzyme activase